MWSSSHESNKFLSGHKGPRVTVAIPESPLGQTFIFTWLDPHCGHSSDMHASTHQSSRDNGFLKTQKHTERHTHTHQPTHACTLMCKRAPKSPHAAETERKIDRVNKQRRQVDTKRTRGHTHTHNTHTHTHTYQQTYTRTNTHTHTYIYIYI